MKVAGLGQCSLDYLVRVDKFPEEDTKPEAEELLIQGGGPVATALVTLRRLGVKCGFMGAVSDDDAGKEIKRGLKEEGVSLRGLVTREGGASQRAFIIVNSKNGTRTVLWKRGSISPLKGSEVNASVIKGSRMLLLDGLMHNASVKAARLARSLGVPVLLDAGRFRDDTPELISLSDYVIASERFAEDLGKAPVRALSEIRAMNPAIEASTITLGPSGSVTLWRANTIRKPAYRIRPIDTTGAGDVFHGGFAYGVINNYSIERAIEFASAVAAMKCRALGGRSAIPNLDEALDFLDRWGPLNA